ncbi:MAG: TonB-dependent receptor [Pyrinomonadaceae bacterium]
MRLEVGEVLEAVTVSGDAPIADTGKTNLGRVMNSREVHNIPLPTRNPYNFIILQANVTGRPNRGFHYPQVNVNGFARRVNYLLDGNTNTRGDRAGARLMLISETFVNEVQLVTNGFAAEFGNTTGMIMNIITPSGTNSLRGSASYLFRRPLFYARPFFFSAAELPDSVMNNVAVTVGGPIIKDRWHFYFGYEWLNRVDNTRSEQQVTISETNKAALIDAGLPASIFVPAIPSREKGSHYIFRTDAQLNGNNRLTARFNHAEVDFGGAGGGFATLERSYDPKGRDYSLGMQLVSFTPRYLNSLRFQFDRSKVSLVRNEDSGTGPSINITNVANFGSPTNIDTVNPLTKVTQIQDNFTWTRGAHAIKLGGGFSFFDNFNRAPVFSLYTFPSIAAYVAARNGTDPFSYTRYEESFGNPETRQQATFWNIFVQDDWKATRRLKINYGLRYDLYLVPEADPSSLFPASRKFNMDKNNFAPRFGVVYALCEGNRPLVLRAGAGIYYEPAWLDMYNRALLNNGHPKFFSLLFCGNNGGVTCPRNPLAPAFPNTFTGSQPPGSVLPTRDIVTVAPDFENMYAIHSNIQLEQALTEDLSLAVGYLHSAGRRIPVYRNINPIGPVRFLADGRPVFGPARLDSRFNVIQMAESAGVSRYDALTLQLTQRFSHGLQFAANYTLSKAVDDAPEQNVVYMGGGFGTSLVLSDPTNRSLDKGYSYGDQRHTFVMSLVARPRFKIRNKTLRFLLNHNQFGVITTTNSGERFSIVSNLDLNGDRLRSSDRPVGIKRNSGKTPAQFNLDLRYSRFFNFGDRFQLDAFGEFQNLFNINRIVSFTDVSVPTDPTTGEMIGPRPDFGARNQSTSQESRQFQLGVKLIF